ncbi:MAG: hypothetical protein P4L51_22785 [Puia sp.]|nr:hypothetical protein [Puia sp.]
MDRSRINRLYNRKHRLVLLVLCFFLAASPRVSAQCSICTRTAQQLGERPAKALNGGIIYLAFTPLAILGLIGYRWWRSAGKEDFHASDPS